MKIAVIGGGVIGLACAWELTRGGADVVVHESGTVGRGCSFGNAGWICPSIAAPLREAGAEIREQQRVDSLRDVNADKAVVAAGLATPTLLPQVRMPLIGARGYSIDVSGSGTPPAHALYLAEARIGISPFDDTVRVAGIFEIGTRKARPDAGARLFAAAAPYLTGWRPTGEGETWSDLRPATADGLPLIGEVATDLYVAAGHTMLGITLAPATAALLAPLVLSGTPDPALACLD